MGTKERGVMTHRNISGVCKPIIGAFAKHPFCCLAKTLGFISAASLPSRIAYTNYLLDLMFFSPFREQVNVEHFGAQKEAELVVSTGTYCLQ